MFFDRCENKQRAFTLAEVLITLSIIGVIAAMTIPTLMTNYNRRVWETRLKKDFAIATNMCERMLTDQNTDRVQDLDLYSLLSNNNNVNAIQNRIADYVHLAEGMAVSGDNALPGFSMKMNDGSIMYISRIDGLVGLRFYVDVNGTNTNPNTYGNDRFAFNLDYHCAYTETGHANNRAYGTFKRAMHSGWRLPQQPVDWN